MLEILLLVALCRKIGEAARAKGRSAGGYQLMLVAFWFGGEIGVALLGAVVSYLVLGPQDEDGLLCFMYVLALVGAAVGALLAFQIVARLPDADRARDDDDYDRWRDDDRDDPRDRYDR